MNSFDTEQKGFTLVEMLVVMVILSVVIAAVYSLYLVHLKTAYKQDEVVEVQQNLRIAMDSISRDVKMSGVLVPQGTPALTSNCTATVLWINTGAPDGCIARIVNNPLNLPSGTYAPGAGNFPFTVDAVNGFNKNDNVRIVRTFTNSQPMNNSIMQVTATPVASTLTVAIPVGGVTINPSDVIAKAAPTAAVANFDTITYSIVTSGTAAGVNCPVGSCLARQVNAPAPPALLPAPAATEIVASNLTTPLTFSYINDSNAVVNTLAGLTPTSLSLIRSVSVTINGATTKPNMPVSTRQITSIIELRNRR
ncbi:MAG: prepilin-type N-terminal cleavage/methylation domain-containing protein [Geobacteraceae bacterium]|jgi:prepilin-type N-terminal cleavage/methylation domain-containing protein